MTADEYVASIIAKYEVPRGPQSPSELAANNIAPVLRNWAGVWLAELFYSGSYAKGTGVRGVADVDLFISLKADTPGTLKDLYEGLVSLATSQNWSPRRQNVSVRISYAGVAIDLVLGRIQAGYVNYHSLYWRPTDSWRQTNVRLHVDTVTASSRQREIRAVKIWRYLKQLDFPSLYLELFVIDALRGRRADTLADNVLQALRAIGQSLATTRIEDPANTNNVLSDDLTVQEKKNIASSAARSASEQSWGSIIW